MPTAWRTYGHNDGRRVATCRKHRGTGGKVVSKFRANGMRNDQDIMTWRRSMSKTVACAVLRRVDKTENVSLC